MKIEFVAIGKPEPAGSKTAGVIYRNGQPILKNGRPLVTTRDANPKAKDWKQAVAFYARQAYRGELLRGPLRLTITFYRPRPKGHFNSKGSLNKSGAAAEYPISKPDVLKQTRCVEDALSGVLYLDDAQIVDEHLFKRYGEPARCEVVVEAIGAPEPTEPAKLF